MRVGRHGHIVQPKPMPGAGRNGSGRLRGRRQGVITRSFRSPRLVRPAAKAASAWRRIDLAGQVTGSEGVPPSRRRWVVVRKHPGSDGVSAPLLPNCQPHLPRCTRSRLICCQGDFAIGDARLSGAFDHKAFGRLIGETLCQRCRQAFRQAPERVKALAGPFRLLAIGGEQRQPQCACHRQVGVDAEAANGAAPGDIPRAGAAQSSRGTVVRRSAVLARPSEPAASPGLSGRR